jgi:hypothetical protein
MLCLCLDFYVKQRIVFRLDFYVRQQGQLEDPKSADREKAVLLPQSKPDIFA